MSYDPEKLTRLKSLKALAERIATDFATKTEVTNLSKRVDDIVSTGGEPNTINTVKVNGTVLPIDEAKAVNVPVPGYAIAKDEAPGDFAAIYHLTKDGANTGVAINIPKDQVVQSGAVVTDPEGQAAGTYLKIVLQNVENPLYINVTSLIEYVTSGSAVGDMVVVAVDEATHKVTATITDGTITMAKLSAEVQAAISKATKVEAGTTPGTIKVDGVVVTVVSIASDAEVTEMLNEVFGTPAA